MDFLFFEGEAVIIIFRTVLVDFFYSIVIYLTLTLPQRRWRFLDVSLLTDAICCNCYYLWRKC